jgi:hypothetical protein
MSDKIIQFDNFTIEPIVGLELFKTNSRLLNKLKLDIEQNNSYEIHQLYKTIHFRLIFSFFSFQNIT